MTQKVDLVAKDMNNFSNNLRERLEKELITAVKDAVLFADTDTDDLLTTVRATMKKELQDQIEDLLDQNTSPWDILVQLAPQIALRY